MTDKPAAPTIIYECKKCGRKFSNERKQRQHIVGHWIAGELSPGER